MQEMYMKQLLYKLRTEFWDKTWLQNVLVWLLMFALLNFAARFEGETNFVEKFSSIIGVTLFVALPIYATNLGVLPLWKKKRYTVSILLYMLILSVFAISGKYIIFFAVKVASWIFNQTSVPLENFDLGKFWNAISSLGLATFCGLAVRIARDSILQSNKQKTAELNLLKAQLNPHFLFNTLNNLYGLAVVKSDKLPDLMLQLSDLLRYGLYDTSERWVPLEKEIHYIKNYINLERLRLEEDSNICFKLCGKVENQRIAPMMLIVFLENAFKHFDVNEDNRSIIEARLEIEPGYLKFYCFNTTNDQLKESPRSITNSGIGLVNVRKRLELLYPQRYQLEVKKGAGEFWVNLELELDQMVYEDTMPSS